MCECVARLFGCVGDVHMCIACVCVCVCVCVFVYWFKLILKPTVTSCTLGKQCVVSVMAIAWLLR